MNSLPINNSTNMSPTAEALLFRFPEVIRIDLIHNSSFIDPVGNNVTAEPTTPSYFEIGKKEDLTYYIKTHNIAMRIDEIAIPMDEFVIIVPGQIIYLDPSLKAPCFVFVITNEDNLKSIHFKLKSQAELTCPICSEIFYECVTLDCIHSFCVYCILNYVKTRQSQQSQQLQEPSEPADILLKSQSCPICKGIFKSFKKDPKINTLCQAFSSAYPKDQTSQEKIIRDDQPIKTEFKDQSGNRYKGYWKNGKKNGFGTMNFESGDVFNGLFENDLIKQGRMTYSNNKTYQGHWKNNKRHGEGVLKFSLYGKNYEYKGSFVNDKKHGLGILIVKDENSIISELKAEFIEGRPEDKGQIKYKDGEIYDGDLKEMFLRHGFGKMTFPDKKIYEGEWKENQMHGLGTMTYSNGSIYVGNWSKGVEDGEGKMIYTDDEICLGHWVDGKFIKNQETIALEDQETSGELNFESDLALIEGWEDLES